MWGMLYPHMGLEVLVALSDDTQWFGQFLVTIIGVIILLDYKNRLFKRFFEQICPI